MTVGSSIVAEGHEAGCDASARRFRLNCAPRVWIVDAGAVDLFAFRAVDGEEAGALHHVLRVNEGEVILALPSSADLDVRIIADVGSSAKVSACAIDRFYERASESADQNSHLCLLERWIENLSCAVVGRIAPKNSVVVGLESELDVGEHPLGLVPDQGVIWVQHSAGASRLLGKPGLTAIDGSFPYPVSRFGWVEAEQGSRLSASRSRAVLERGLVGAGLYAFHCDMLKCLAARLRDQDERDCRRLQKKAAVDHLSMVAAVRELSSPFEDDVDPIASAPIARVEPPLMLACRAIGKSMGIEMRPHPEMIRGATLANPITAIAKASGVRVRRVALKGNWWKELSGPLLVFRQSDQRPLAVTPGNRNRRWIVDAADGRRERLDGQSAGSLDPFAYSFYRPLPNKCLTMKDVLTFALKGCLGDIAVIIGMGLASGLLALVTPIATGVVFDSLIPGDRRADLALACAFLLVSAVASALFQLVSSFGFLRLENRMDSAVQAAVWDRLLNLPARFFRAYSAGDLAMRSMGISRVRDFLTGSVLGTILSGFFSVFSFGLLFYYDLRLALAAVVLVSIACGMSLLSSRLELGYQRRQESGRGRVSSLVLEFISGIAKLRVAGAEKRAYAIWVRAFGALKAAEISGSRISAGFGVLNSVYPLFCTLVMYYLGASATAAAGGGSFTTGSFLAFMAAFSQALNSLLNLTSGCSAFLRALPGFERVSPILTAQPEVSPLRSSAGALKGALDASHLVFRYRPDAPLVLCDISFTVQPGRYVAIVGPSGCGKSTLFRLLLGFETPESGAVYFDGHDLATLDMQEVRRQIGTVLQSGTIMRGTILSNIIGDSALTAADAWEAARLAGLEDDIKRMPMGMSTMISEGSGGVSGGQRQRLQIARAIVNKPRILLFDEATSALDNRTQAIVTESLKAMQSTRIVIAHRLSTVIDADTILVMDQGKIVQSGNYDKLMREPGLFAELARRQIA